jgi:hypothetical protein
MMLVMVGLLLRPVASQMEAMALGVKQRPWLAGRLGRWQKLILPFQTSAVLSTGLGCAMSGGGYLLSAAPGWDAPNVAAFAFVVVGGLLSGFALSRLLAGTLIVHVSGLWAAPKWAWHVGGAIVAFGSLAHAVYSAENVLHLASSV